MTEKNKKMNKKRKILNQDFLVTTAECKTDPAEIKVCLKKPITCKL